MKTTLILLAISLLAQGQSTYDYGYSTTASSGLSPGAYAGIGVGATLTVIIIATIAFFLFRKRRRNLLKYKDITSHPEDHREISYIPDTTGELELSSGSSKKYGFMSTIYSNRHEVEAPVPGVPVTSTSTSTSTLTSADRRHELHGETASYRRNGESDTTACHEMDGFDDHRGEGGGPGAATELR